MESTCGYKSSITPTPMYSGDMFTCSKCNHQWFQRSPEGPRRCPNHSCRSVYWKHTGALAAQPPVEKPDKKADLASLQELIATVQAKPKSDYHTKSIMPEYPKPVEDQPDFYEEPTYQYGE